MENAVDLYLTISKLSNDHEKLIGNKFLTTCIRTCRRSIKYFKFKIISFDYLSLISKSHVFHEYLIGTMLMV